MASVPDKLRLTSSRPSVDELKKAVDSALREIAAAYRAIEKSVSSITEIVASSPAASSADIDIAAIIAAAVAESTRGIPGATALKAVIPHPDKSVRYLIYLSSVGDGMGGQFVYDASCLLDDTNIDYIRPNDVGEGFPGRWVRNVNAS